VNIPFSSKEDPTLTPPGFIETVVSPPFGTSVFATFDPSIYRSTFVDPLPDAISNGIVIESIAETDPESTVSENAYPEFPTPCASKELSDSDAPPPSGSVTETCVFVGSRLPSIETEAESDDDALPDTDCWLSE
jgi:hypothetical protein